MEKLCVSVYFYTMRNCNGIAWGEGTRGGLVIHKKGDASKKGARFHHVLTMIKWTFPWPE